MSRQQKVLFPKLSPGCSSFQFSGSALLLNRRDEDKPTHRVFRTKRKHVQRACDRCRVKKSKCDGNQPCGRCITYNHACIFRDRKATQEKVYSRGFVEMLISQHDVHLRALRDLYKRCVTREGFPGSPLQDSGQGYPGTHAILDRLGLIKHAEATVEDPQKVLEDMIDYLKSLDTSSECFDCVESTDTSDTTGSDDPSPEPTTPNESSDLSVAINDCKWTWTGISDIRRVSHLYDEFGPYQQLRNESTSSSASVPPISFDDPSCAFRGHNGHPEVSWDNFPSQMRYIPAVTDAVCQRTGLPTDMQWQAMASHLTATMTPVSSRGGAPETPLYSTEQTCYPEFYGYAHLYSAGSSS